jgi:hypothetical protein
MPYETVFEITQKPYEWWWPAIGLIFLAVGVVFVRYGPRLDRKNSGKNFGPIFAIPTKPLGWFFVIFASFWTLIAFGFTYSSYRELTRAYRAGRYSVVEGTVEDFHPMPYEGHQNECFRVEKERFCYSDYELSPGFNQSASHGGPIRAGLPVRIAYYQDENFHARILRLEIRADSLPSRPDRAAYAKREEEKWHQLAKNDPTEYRSLLGFSFAGLLISLWWTLDWKHCIRFWIRSGPPYSRLVTLGFRGFFLACLVGSIIQLVRVISERPPTIVDFEGAAPYILLPIGLFGVADFVFRKRLYGRKQSTDGHTFPPSS